MPLQGALNALVYGWSLPSIRDVYRTARGSDRRTRLAGRCRLRGGLRGGLPSAQPPRSSAEGALLQAQSRKIQRLQGDAKAQEVALHVLSSELRDVDGPSHRVVSLRELGDAEQAGDRVEGLETQLAETEAALAEAQQENAMLSEHLEAAIESAGKLRAGAAA